MSTLETDVKNWLARQLPARIEVVYCTGPYKPYPFHDIRDPAAFVRLPCGRFKLVRVYDAIPVDDVVVKQ